MAYDLTIQLEDRPGSLADLAETLGNAGINIEGLFGASKHTGDVIHVLVLDAAGARQILDAAGFPVLAEREVMAIPVEDRPGVLGIICRQLHAVDVNIDLIYLATNNRLVLGVDDLEKLRKAL